MSIHPQKRQSPQQSERSSSCASPKYPQQNQRRKSFTAMHVPSVQQLANLAAVDNAVDKAASSGYRPSLVLEPDFIAALQQRVRTQESTSSSSAVRERRKSSFAEIGGPLATIPGSRRNSSASVEAIPGSRRNSRRASLDGNSGHSPAVGQAYPGLPITSNDAAYQLIPTENSEEDKEEAKPMRKTGSRRIKRESQKLANQPWWQTRGQEVLQGLCFQTVMALLIICNSLVIGLETDMTSFDRWDDIENSFLFAFLGELLLKLLFYGVVDLYDRDNPDFNWNVFDSFIVSLGLLDFIASYLTTSKGGGVATLFRIVRLLRILRIIRIVKFLKQLYLLAVGLAEAAQAVFWVTILMTFILYVCSIIMVKTIGRPPDTDPNQEFLNRHFGSVLPSMLSLFVLMSSPNLPVYQDQVGLLEERPCLALFMVGFIVFGSFGMVALLTGVISESMFEKNNMRKEEERIEHEKLRMDVGVRCAELYDTFDKNEEDEVNIEDLKDEDTIDEMAKTFELAGVFVTSFDLATMVEYLDVDGSGTITKDEFMRGMLVLAEGLRPISVQEVHHDVGVCRVKLERVEASLEGMMTEIREVNSKTCASSDSSSTSSYADFGVDSDSKSILENISQQINDMVASQKNISRNFQDLDGRMREISRQVQNPLGEDISSLKAYVSTRLQELGQQIIQQCSKERSCTSSRWNDVGFQETRSQASCTLSTMEPSPRAGHDSTCPSLSFSAAGSSAEQAAGGTSSTAAGIDQKLFTFDFDQFVPPTRQQSEEVRTLPEVADSVSQAERQASTTTALTAAGTAASASAIASLASPPAQDSLLANQVQELINWQQRVETELRRVSQMTQQEAATRTTQSAATLTSARPTEVTRAARSPTAQQVPETSSAAQSAQSPEGIQDALPLQAVDVARLLQSLQSLVQPLSSAAALTHSVAEPARHPSAPDNTASLAQLLSHMRGLVSNQEVLQRSSAIVSAREDTSQSSEVLDC